MIAILAKVWAYRTEILLAIQVLSALRKTAAEFAREYIRRKIRAEMKRQLLVVGGQLSLLLAALVWQANSPGLAAEGFASTALWGITLYNIYKLSVWTIPELIALRRSLKSKTGYALKYLLEVSLVTELLQMDVVFLALCLSLGVGSRTWVSASFSYTEPWKKLFSTSSPTAPRRRRIRRDGVSPHGGT